MANCDPPYVRGTGCCKCCPPPGCDKIRWVITSYKQYCTPPTIDCEGISIPLELTATLSGDLAFLGTVPLVYNEGITSWIYTAEDVDISSLGCAYSTADLEIVMFIASFEGVCYVQAAVAMDEPNTSNPIGTWSFNAVIPTENPFEATFSTPSPTEACATSNPTVGLYITG